MAIGASDADNGMFAEFIDDFFAECDEHLTIVRRTLLALAPSIDQPRVNRDLLDELFRSFHSLKGLAGMVGAAEVEQLAHHMESYLRALRQGQFTLNAEGFEALIAGTQLLEQIVIARRTDAQTPAIELMLARLAALVPELAPPHASAAPAPTSSLAAFTPDEQARLAVARAQGDTIWLVTFTSSPLLAKRDINVNSVRGRLQALGQLIRAAPRVLSAGGIAFDFVIGISTGGPHGLKQVIPRLSADFSLPVAIVLHMPVGYTELYAQSLNALALLDVAEAREGALIQPGKVLLAPAGHHLTLRREPDGTVVAHLNILPLDTPHRPSVDVLFQSAAHVFGSRVLGIVMTGMGADGVQGAAWIKAQGGMVWTEAEETCVVYGMPRSVVEAGLSDRSVALTQIAQALQEVG